MKKLLLLSLLVLFGCSKDDNKEKLFERLENKVFIPENSSIENAITIFEFAEYWTNMVGSPNGYVTKYLHRHTNINGDECWLNVGFPDTFDYEIDVHTSDYMRMKILLERGDGRGTNKDEAEITVAILGENPMRVEVKFFRSTNFFYPPVSQYTPSSTGIFTEISRDDVRDITEKWGCLQYYF